MTLHYVTKRNSCRFSYNVSTFSFILNFTSLTYSPNFIISTTLSTLGLYWTKFLLRTSSFIRSHILIKTDFFSYSLLLVSINIFRYLLHQKTYSIQTPYVLCRGTNCYKWMKKNSRYKVRVTVNVKSQGSYSIYLQEYISYLLIESNTR